MASSSNPSCGCLPLLYHAIEMKALRSIDPALDYTLGPRESRCCTNNMVSMLLSEGCDLNLHYRIENRDSSDDGQAITLWAVWLSTQMSFFLSKDRAITTRQEKVAMLNALEAFIKAGADLRSTQVEIRSIQRAVLADMSLSEEMEQVMRLYEKRRRAQEMGLDEEEEKLPIPGAKR
ncbi:hypothetical protein F4810DRAFT_655183 [Camillea tinctor]|nr:hypothetical protein F4810DRAFT_655183 [Camillea tinctor]